MKLKKRGVEGSFILLKYIGKSIPFSYILDFVILSEIRCGMELFGTDNNNCKSNVQ